MTAPLTLLLTILLFTTDLLAAELSTPIRYGHDADGVRVLLDLDLPLQTQDQRRISERLLLSVPLVWLPPGETWQFRINDSYKAMLADITEAREEFPDAASVKEWNSDGSIVTTWNSSLLLSCRASNQSYTGGAHGNSQTQAILLDLRAERVLTLDDIILPALQPTLSELLTAAYKKAKNIPEHDRLRDHALHVDVLPAKLPLITATGISVVYQPYEIAAYAAGTITVDLPRHVVRPLLTRDVWADVE